MADVVAVYEELVTQWITDFAVNVVKGRPTWTRPDAVLPVAALEILAWSPGSQRVGQRQARQTATYRGWFFARNEPELVAFVAQLAAWGADHSLLIIAGERIECVIQEALRHQPETAAQQEQHALVWTLTTTL